MLSRKEQAKSGGIEESKAWTIDIIGSDMVRGGVADR